MEYQVERHNKSLVFRPCAMKWLWGFNLGARFRAVVGAGANIGAGAEAVNHCRIQFASPFR